MTSALAWRVACCGRAAHTVHGLAVRPEGSKVAHSQHDECGVGCGPAPLPPAPPPARRPASIGLAFLHCRRLSIICTLSAHSRSCKPLETPERVSRAPHCAHCSIMPAGECALLATRNLEAACSARASRHCPPLPAGAPAAEADQATDVGAVELAVPGPGSTQDAAAAQPAATAAAAAQVAGSSSSSSAGGQASAQASSSDDDEDRGDVSGAGYASSSVRGGSAVGWQLPPWRRHACGVHRPPPSSPPSPLSYPSIPLRQESEPDLAEMVARLKAVLSVSEDSEVQLVRLRLLRLAHGDVVVAGFPASGRSRRACIVELQQLVGQPPGLRAAVNPRLP